MLLTTGTLMAHCPDSRELSRKIAVTHSHRYDRSVQPQDLPELSNAEATMQTRCEALCTYFASQKESLVLKHHPKVKSSSCKAIALPTNGIH